MGVFTGHHPGCVEERKNIHSGFKGACEFDGRMSVLQWEGRIYMFARANTPERHVQVTSSSNFQDWSPFSLIHINGVDTHNHIYFLQAEEWNTSHIVGFFPGEVFANWGHGGHGKT